MRTKHTAQSTKITRTLTLTPEILLIPLCLVLCPEQELTHTRGSSSTSFPADALHSLSTTEPSCKPLLAVRTHEDTLEAISPIHWQHYVHIQAKTKDLEVTERGSQGKHLLACVFPGLQHIAQKAFPKLLCCLQTILYLRFDLASEGSCPTHYTPFKLHWWNELAALSILHPLARKLSGTRSISIPIVQIPVCWHFKSYSPLCNLWK